MEDKKIKVLDRMRNLCSRREYCRSDIFSKVCRALEDDRNAAAEVVDELVKDRYIDESRYASAFARDKSALSGWGVVKIRHALSMKGVPRDVISEALKEIDDSRAHSRLEKLLEVKYRSIKEDPQWRIKLLRYALGRGYEYDEVSDIISKLTDRS